MVATTVASTVDPGLMASPVCEPLRFYLGTHQPAWLATAGVPLFVSHRRLAGRRRLPEAVCAWALDSGGFTELTLYGRWQTPVVEYVDAVRRYAAEIGRLAWAAPMDWMCEPAMLTRTGLSVAEHQARTVANFLELRQVAPDLPFIPVLQGWTLADYLTCAARYQAEGIELPRLPLVGLGSVCRRQHTGQIAEIATTLTAELCVRLHGFGVKRGGLATYADALASADSMAWSLAARRRAPLPGCRHRNCANCLRYALAWRVTVLDELRVQQLRLPLGQPLGVGDPR